METALAFTEGNEDDTEGSTRAAKGSEENRQEKPVTSQKGCSVRIVRPKSPLFFRETVAGSEP